MGLVLGLLFDAAVIGIIIAFMERGDFPGWGPMLACVIGIAATSRAVATLLPENLALLGVVAGAAVGAWMISWLCDMSLGRAAKAAGIYLAVGLALSLAFSSCTG